MEAFCIFLAALAALLWIGFALIPWRPWSNQEVFDVKEESYGDEVLNEITVMMPARNEAEVIAQSLKSLTEQGPSVKIILIDDRSDDATVEKAFKCGVLIFALSKASRFRQAGTAS